MNNELRELMVSKCEWVNKLKSPSLFTYHTDDDLNSADPSSVQDARHVWTQ